jgi:hypothetical protein
MTLFPLKYGNFGAFLSQKKSFLLFAHDFMYV